MKIQKPNKTCPFSMVLVIAMLVVGKFYFAEAFDSASFYRGPKYYRVGLNSFYIDSIKYDIIFVNVYIDHFNKVREF